MLLSGGGILVVKLDPVHHVAVVYQLPLAADAVPCPVHVVAHDGVAKERAVRSEKVAVSPDVGHHLWVAERRVLEVAEAEALAVRGADPDIGAVHQDVDVVVAELLRGVQHDEVLPTLLEGHVALL